jgi:phage gpG-like protein
MSNDWKLTWNGKEIGEMAAKRLKVNAEKAARMIEADIVRSLSVGHREAVRRGDGSLMGLDPSIPGQPPHLLTGHLRRSIDHRVEKHPKYIDIFVVAGASYARVLEYGGMSGKANIAARPFMRPALARNRDKAISMLVKNLFSRQGISDRRRRT